VDSFLACLPPSLNATPRTSRVFQNDELQPDDHAEGALEQTALVAATEKAFALAGPDSTERASSTDLVGSVIFDPAKAALMALPQPLPKHTETTPLANLSAHVVATTSPAVADASSGTLRSLGANPHLSLFVSSPSKANPHAAFYTNAPTEPQSAVLGPNPHLSLFVSSPSKANPHAAFYTSAPAEPQSAVQPVTDELASDAVEEGEMPLAAATVLPAAAATDDAMASPAVTAVPVAAAPDDEMAPAAAAALAGDACDQVEQLKQQGSEMLLAAEQAGSPSMRRNQLEIAERKYSDALSIDTQRAHPSAVVVLANRAHARLKLAGKSGIFSAPDKYAGCIADCEAALELHPPQSIRIKVLYRRARAHLALACAPLAEPDSLRQAQQLEAAQSDFHAVLALDPANKEAQRWMAAASQLSASFAGRRIPENSAELAKWCAADKASRRTADNALDSGIAPSAAARSSAEPAEAARPPSQQFRASKLAANMSMNAVETVSSQLVKFVQLMKQGIGDIRRQKASTPALVGVILALLSALVFGYFLVIVCWTALDTTIDDTINPQPPPPPLSPLEVVMRMPSGLVKRASATADKMSDAMSEVTDKIASATMNSLAWTTTLRLPPPNATTLMQLGSISLNVSASARVLSAAAVSAMQAWVHSAAMILVVTAANVWSRLIVATSFVWSTAQHHLVQLCSAVISSPVASSTKQAALKSGARLKNVSTHCGRQLVRFASTFGSKTQILLAKAAAINDAIRAWLAVKVQGHHVEPLPEATSRGWRIY